MSMLTSSVRPTGAAAKKWVNCVMDVVLHIGAHRTGTSSFQDYMLRHVTPLAEAGVGYWGPERTRRGLFSDLVPAQDGDKVHDLRQRAEGRVQLQLTAARARETKTLVVSDENICGSVSENIKTGTLYAGIGDCMARFARAFEGQLSTVLISPRSLELYWSSTVSYGVAQGHEVPGRDKLRLIAQSSRGWRDVITDVARAIPSVEVKVLPFERFVGRPEVFLECGAGVKAPKDTNRSWLNRAPNLAELRRVLTDRGVAGAVLPFGMERWNPFTPEENSALRETFADDMMWLVAGADGLATLTEDNARTRAGKILPAVAQIQGHGDEHEKRQVARPG